MTHVSQNAAPEHGRVRAANLRTGLILASIALAFFVGIVLKYWVGL